METLAKINILILIIILNIVGFSQNIENGWKAIKPLKTNKTTVDKILGKPETDDNGYQRYSMDEAFIRVNYSTLPCQDDPYDRGKYVVPKKTVLDYYVVLEKDFVPLSEFGVNLKKYEKDTSGDLINFINYRNNDIGIDFAVTVQETFEFVREIRFTPSKKDNETFKCKEVKKGI